MKQLYGQTVTVAGAGALGLTAALALADAGASVTVCDPAGHGDNASGVAAGMLAPAFESVLDPPASGASGLERFALLTAARDLWPELMSRIGQPDGLDRTGAVMAVGRGEAAAAAATEARMRGLGMAPERLTGAALRRLHPALSEDLVEGLYTGEDWRLEPAAVLAALNAALVAAGGRIVRARLTRVGEGLSLAGRPVEGAVVLAAGAEDLAGLAPELAHLAPVKGQILHFAVGPASGAVVRGLGGYVTPQPGGAVAGATMEPGRRDLTLDPEALARLRADAARLFPHLAAAPATGRAGIRATAPDGLPMVGRSRGDGPGPLILCAGARRNGWLLAPLTARAVVRALAGGEAEPAFQPGRFD